MRRRRALVVVCALVASITGHAQRFHTAGDEAAPLVPRLNLARNHATPPPPIQVGLCTALAQAELAKGSGFDYVELGTTEIAALSDAAFERMLVDIRTIDVATPVANLFLPETIKVTGPDVNADAQLAYARKAFPRLVRLGVSLVVFDSGGARNVPDGFDRKRAFDQLVEFGRRIGPEARAHGLTVVVEPLNRDESNIINTTTEALRLVTAVADPNFDLMVDFYHFASEGENPAVLVAAGSHLRHLHAANPDGRVFPLDWSEFAYDDFFAALRDLGYAGRISIDAASPNIPTQGPQAIALLRQAFAP